MQIAFRGNIVAFSFLKGAIMRIRKFFSDLKTEEPVATLEDVSSLIEFDGKEYGPFYARGSRRNPGTYQTRHIFTTPGDGDVTLSFKKAGSDEVLTLTLPCAVQPRKSIEIP